MIASGHPGLRPPRYSTAEVALILNTEAWRIKNFAVPGYGLEPTFAGNGRGTRRFYGWEALLRLAVANELYDSGIGPDGIKTAIAAIDDQKAIQKWSGSYTEHGKGKSLSLMLGDRKKNDDGNWERSWRIMDSQQAKNENGDLPKRGIAVVCLDLTAIWEWIVQRITELEGEGKL